MRQWFFTWFDLIIKMFTSMGLLLIWMYYKRMMIQYFMRSICASSFSPNFHLQMGKNNLKEITSNLTKLG